MTVSMSHFLCFLLRELRLTAVPDFFLSKYYKRGWFSYFLFVFIGFRSSWQFSRYSSSWYWSTEITAGKLLVYINLICNNRYRLLTRSYKPFGHSWIVWYTYTLSFRLRKQQTLAMSPLVFPWNQVEEWAQKYPYWWFATNHVCVFTSDWWKQIFPQSITNHKHKPSLKSNTTSDVRVKFLRSFCGETSGCITKCQLFYWTIGLQD